MSWATINRSVDNEDIISQKKSEGSRQFQEELTVQSVSKRNQVGASKTLLNFSPQSQTVAAAPLLTGEHPKREGLLFPRLCLLVRKTNKRNVSLEPGADSLHVRMSCHLGHPQLPRSWEKQYPANEIMIPKTGLHHDGSRSQVCHRQLKFRCVNEEAGLQLRSG